MKSKTKRVFFFLKSIYQKLRMIPSVIFSKTYDLGQNLKLQDNTKSSLDKTIDNSVIIREASHKDDNTYFNDNENAIITTESPIFGFTISTDFNTEATDNLFDVSSWYIPRGYVSSNVCMIVDQTAGFCVGVYESFEKAISEVRDGEIIRLLEDIRHDSGLVIENKSIVFDLNGYTLDLYNKNGHGLEVGTYGEVSLLNWSGGEFNVKGDGLGDKHGVFVHNGGKAEVTNAVSSADGIGARGVKATGQKTEVTVYGNILKGSFYGLGAYDGACVTVFGHVEGSGGMTVRNKDTSVTVYGCSNGEGTGVIASDGATVTVKGNVLGGGAGIVVSSGAKIIVDGYVNVLFDKRKHIMFNGLRSAQKMQQEHEETSSKDGYF